ncbi:MAG TPA: phospholipase D-like domain-containing protein [Polyangia bacterium]
MTAVHAGWVWLFSHLSTVLGFLLALVILARVLGERRAPASTFAWLLAVALVPYVGVPLYLVFGGRKLARRAAKKARLYPASDPPDAPGADLERILRSDGAPRPSSGNRVALFATGEAAFAGLLEMIESAERSIHIATFILGDDEVGHAVLERLARKAAAGVEVRLLLDALFSFRASRRDLAALVRSGGKLATFMPVVHLPFRGHANLRNHRKIVVVDGVTAMVGGMNLAREYMGPEPLAGRWCDVSMRVDGPAAADLQAVFRSDWSFAAGESLRAGEQKAAASGAATIQVAGSGPDTSSDTLYDAYLTGLFQARRRIFIATPYFIPDEALARALVLAARRGVDVRVLVPARSNHRIADLAGASYLRQVQEAGARICLFHPGMMHAKVTVIDDAVGVLGSANLDMRSLFLDYEISLFFYSPSEIELIADWFTTVQARSGGRLPRRGRLRGLGEDLGRLVAPLV